MTDDSTQLQRLRSAVERLSAPGGRGVRSDLDDLVEIAEAAERLTPSFRHLHPSIPWLVLAEMRRVIVRAGDAVDTRTVAVTLDREIPELRARLRDL
jgi:uncharacterized protein with HEPN domain